MPSLSSMSIDRPRFNAMGHFNVERMGRDEARMNGSFRPGPVTAEQDWHKRRDRRRELIQERNSMNKTLLSLSAVATLVIGATTMTAQAAPITGSAPHSDAGLVHKAHGDRYGRWDDGYSWRHRHWGGDWRPWHRRWWRHRHHDHRGDREWRGDRGHGHGDHREHRRGDWR